MDKQATQPATVSYFSIGIVRMILFVLLLLLLKGAVWLPALLILFLLLTLEGAVWWSKAGLKHLDLSKTLKHRRFFPGEETTLTIQIINQKKLPSILGWRQPLPEGFRVKALPAEILEDQGLMLMGGQSHTSTYTLEALQRGYWELPSLALFSQDGLGLFEQIQVQSTVQQLFVYPALIPLEQLTLKVSDLLGVNKVQRPYLPDPVRLVSLRQYTYDTPARLIHWKASLSKGQLYAKVLEPSGEYKLYILVDVAALALSQDQAKFEKALSVAATLISWAQELNIPFGVLCNGRQKGISGPLALPVANGLVQLQLALERLARLEYVPQGELRALLALERQTIPAGTSYIAIGPCTVDHPHMIHYPI